MENETTSSIEKKAGRPTNAEQVRKDENLLRLSIEEPISPRKSWFGKAVAPQAQDTILSPQVVRNNEVKTGPLRDLSAKTMVEETEKELGKAGAGDMDALLSKSALNPSIVEGKKSRLNTSPFNSFFTRILDSVKSKPNQNKP